jgi:hypothetical protein
MYTEQVAQFIFRPKQVLESALVEFLEKSLNSSRIAERSVQQGAILH